MINLLNPATIKELRWARLNVRLRQYALLMIGVGLGVLVVYGAGFWFAHQEYVTATAQHDKALAGLKDYSAVKKQIADYRSNLTIADKILDNGIVFSTFLTDTGSIMPANTILSNLSLTTASTNSSGQKPGAAQLQAWAKSYDDTLRLKESLEKSPLFSDVHLTTASAPEKPVTTGIRANYPIEATYNLVIDQLGASQ